MPHLYQQFAACCYPLLLHLRHDLHHHSLHNICSTALTSAIHSTTLSTTTSLIYATGDVRQQASAARETAHVAVLTTCSLHTLQVVVMIITAFRSPHKQPVATTDLCCQAVDRWTCKTCHQVMRALGNISAIHAAGAQDTRKTDCNSPTSPLSTS